MKRRWKVGITLAAVGLAGFLVWAFLSSAKPPLTIHFVGYTTNDISHLIPEAPSGTGKVFALFAVTKQTGRTMDMAACDWRRLPPGRVGFPVTWMGATNYYFLLGSKSVRFNPGEGALVAARAHETNEPIEVLASCRPSRLGNTAWNHFRARLPWNQRWFSATATSEPR